MNYITFTYGKTIKLGRCVFTAQDDTTMASYWNTTESSYKNFTTLGITAGESVYFDLDGSTIFIGRISSIAASVITLAGNPGQKVYNEILKYGYIQPYISRIPDVQSYPFSKYAGSSLSTKGSNYDSYAESNPNKSDATTVNTNSVISLFFEKGNTLEEVRINVKVGSESVVINSINKAFKQSRDISFTSDMKSINADIIGVSKIVSSSKAKFY